MVRRLLPLSALLAAVVTAGCQTRARLTESGGPLEGSPPVRLSGKVALFSVNDKEQQTILLAFRATGAKSAPPPPPLTGPGQLILPKPPLPYRTYLLLAVRQGGGDFTIGQNLPGGQVRAYYYAYNERDELDRVVADHRGTITTRAWPLMGGASSQEDWWTSGSFDLRMGNGMRLTGDFVARPAPLLVAGFIKEKRL